MNTFGDCSLAITAKIIVALLYVHHVDRTHSLQNDVSMYTALVKACSSYNFNNRHVLEVRDKFRGQAECLMQCTRNILCELVVYQEFNNGAASCTKLSAIRSDSPTTLDVSTSIRCVTMSISLCLNEGQMQDGVCLCQAGFAGEECENTIPSFCNVQWIESANLTKGQSLHYDVDVVKDFGRSNPKIKVRDSAMKVLSVMKAMHADRDNTSYLQLYWYLETFPFFEKVAWNKFAANPQRQYKHYLYNGEFQLLSYNGGLKKFIFTTGKLSEFSFINAKETRFAVNRNMPNDWTMMTDDMNNGHELYDSTWISQNDEKQMVVAQFADRYLNMYVGGHFVDPPLFVNFKYVLGIAIYKTKTYIGRGVASETGNGTVRKDNYLNPCWTSLSEETYDKKTSSNGWNILGTYLRLGNEVRVKVGPTYHSILEVIQIGDSFTFLLAPSLSETDTTEFTKSVYGVRSLISSSAIYESCTHQIEGEQIIGKSRFESSYNVIWFVDTRRWRKVLAVFSNSSVHEGSVTDLASGVTKGSDVRVWIQWLRSGVSRYVETHMNSVTDDGKVSSESLVTWKTTTDTVVRLSPTCDLEYILVTSDGRLEILTFNVWTPGTSVVHSDVMITWFLA